MPTRNWTSVPQNRFGALTQVDAVACRQVAAASKLLKTLIIVAIVNFARRVTSHF